MHPRLPQVFEERGFLRARIAARRKELADYGEPVERLCTVGDSAWVGIGWIRKHLFALSLISGVTLLALRPRRVSRQISHLFIWGRRLFILLRNRKKWLTRLSSLRALFG